jgi:hypothetical protein
MEPDDFYRWHHPKLQGLMTVAIGTFLLLVAVVHGLWWPWSELWRVVAYLAIFASTFLAFYQTDNYYKEHIGVLRVWQPKYLWLIFCLSSSIVLTIGVWSGYSVIGGIAVGILWLHLYERYKGHGWGLERATAVLLAVVGLSLALLQNTAQAGTAMLVVMLAGGILIISGALCELSLRLVVRQIKGGSE